MKFGERQTHAVETDEWPGRQRKKKKSNKRRERKEGDGGGLKGKKKPPIEREGGEVRRGLKGREKEEC